MFSGIIRDVGTIAATSPRGAGIAATIRTRFDLRGSNAVALGDSIAVDGVCLTVDALVEPDGFSVVMGKETLDRTTLGRRPVGSRVNLERALRASDRLDGHIVSGHVDGVGEISEIRTEQESIVIWVQAPPALRKYIAEKGSIAMNGVSLTVNELGPNGFRVGIIPFTADETTLGALQAGDGVNLEVDVVARYLERLLASEEGGLTRQRLNELGVAGPRR